MNNQSTSEAQRVIAYPAYMLALLSNERYRSPRVPVELEHLAVAAIA